MAIESMDIQPMDIESWLKIITKNLHVGGPMQFKIMLLKCQLYFCQSFLPSYPYFLSFIILLFLSKNNSFYNILDFKSAVVTRSFRFRFTWNPLFQNIMDDTVVDYYSVSATLTLL